MYRKQIVFVLFVLSVPCLIFMGGQARAQTVLKLVTDPPDIKKISLGAGQKEVKIKVLTDRQNGKFSWNIEGPGGFSGDTAGSEVTYSLPEGMERESAQVTVTATMNDTRGETSVGQTVFTLLNPLPSGSIRIITDVLNTDVYINDTLEGTAQPGEPLTAEAVPVGDTFVRVKAQGYPAKSKSVLVESGQVSEVGFELNPQAERIEKLLKEGDMFFGQRQFAAPEKNNAFERYKEILTINPENIYALKKIREIVGLCKQENASVGDDHDKAIKFYQQCIPVIHYALNTLGDRALEEDFREMETFLKQSEANTVKPAEDMLKEGDALFDQVYFTTPAGKNAFEIYKTVLATDPENQHARQKIREMGKRYEIWGNTAYKKNAYRKAGFYYRKYLLIASYLSQSLSDPSLESSPVTGEIQKRLKELKAIAQSVENLLKEADSLFAQAQFVLPKEKNAFDVYKEVLKTDPGSRRAWGKIREMLKYFGVMGNDAYDRKNYKESKTLYGNYLLIAQYMADNKSAYPANETEFWEIQNRFGKLENLIIAEQLEPFTQKLSQELEVYEKLRAEEKQGADVSIQMIPMMKTIIGDLKEIESLYEQLPIKDAVILQKIDRVRETRENMEKEIAGQTDNPSSKQ